MKHSIVTIELNADNIRILKHILNVVETNTIHTNSLGIHSWWSGDKKSFIKRQVNSIEFIKSILNLEI